MRKENNNNRTRKKGAEILQREDKNKKLRTNILCPVLNCPTDASKVDTSKKIPKIRHLGEIKKTQTSAGPFCIHF
ncbi:MAG TPA: hypothetical protein DDE71_09015 [Tenacibaculum sp.]|nr:hypothetical protein [Tenacibaculum sp.]